MSIDSSWLLAIPADELRAILRSGELSGISLISDHEGHRLVQNPFDWQVPGNKRGYLFYDTIDKRWVAMDNTTGDCFIEEFFDWNNAVRWLKDSSLGPEDAETMRAKEEKGKEGENETSRQKQ